VIFPCLGYRGAFLQEENRHKKEKALTKLIHIIFVSIKLDLEIKPLKDQVGFVCNINNDDLFCKILFS
jgi:hypothetical protein